MQGRRHRGGVVMRRSVGMRIRVWSERVVAHGRRRCRRHRRVVVMRSRRGQRSVRVPAHRRGGVVRVKRRRTVVVMQVRPVELGGLLHIVRCRR